MLVSALPAAPRRKTDGMPRTGVDKERMSNEALGMIETKGLVASIEAADAAERDPAVRRAAICSPAQPPFRYTGAFPVPGDFLSIAVTVPVTPLG